jgi:hypothetical protein
MDAMTFSKIKLSQDHNIDAETIVRNSTSRSTS